MKSFTTDAERHAYAVVLALQKAGYAAYFAGGAVRDRLLGLPPEDVDVATDCPPDQTARLFARTAAVGKAFGVTLVKHDDAPPTEVARFRTDGPYGDGRRPDWVRPATAEEDVQRRDFTINGLLYDPVADRLLDLVGGEADLRAGLVRAIGDAERRFAEDRLRLFRAVRFAARFDFRIEPTTWKALASHASDVAELAPERVREELTRLLAAPHAGRGLTLLRDAGLLDVWLPEVKAMDGVAQPPGYHPEGDVFTHTALLLDALDEPTPSLAWGALLHDVGKPPTAAVKDGQPTFPRHAAVGAQIADAVCRRLNFANDEREQVTALVSEHMRFLDYPEMRPSTRRRFLALPRFTEHLELHRADCLASHGQLDTYDAVRAELAQTPEPALPPPLIGGDDLIAWGYTPGPQFSVILDAARTRQLDGELLDADAAKRWVLAQWPLDK
ncbi:MAG: CCA tRNA nucleotidyltransferase [Myxococcales bacterium]|nr:MAG: CCA tRNA nucleotidyltransferase [Myxococcales bacterium]